MRAKWFVAWAATGILTLGAVAQTSRPTSWPASRPATAPGTATGALDEQAYKTEEVSVFDASVEFRNSNLTRGQHAQVATQPAEGVKYPKTKSKKPCYGALLIEGIGKYQFLVDSSSGDGDNYDRLTIDMNRNEDLTDDEAITLQKIKAKGPVTFPSSFTFKIDIGGSRRTISAHMESYDKQRAMYFAQHPRQAWITLGTRQYHTLLTHKYMIASNFDDGNLLMVETVGPVGELVRELASRPESNEAEYWWGADDIKQMRCVDGKWYSFAASQSGDKLYVRPYHGEMGILSAGIGQRNATDLGKPPAPRESQSTTGRTSQLFAPPPPPRPIASLRGSLMSKDRRICVGDLSSGRGWPDAVEKAEIPEGDYTAAILNAQMGALAIEVSNNYHSEGRRTVEDTVFGFTIRKDKPFVLDFSNKPEVIWPSPAKNAVLKRSQTVQIKAVLIDPKLDLMIRGLNDTSRKIKKKFSSGEEWEMFPALDPKVTITDSSGREMASGVMPFG